MQTDIDNYSGFFVNGLRNVTYGTMRSKVRGSYFLELKPKYGYDEIHYKTLLLRFSITIAWAKIKCKKKTKDNSENDSTNLKSVFVLKFVEIFRADKNPEILKQRPTSAGQTLNIDYH